MAAMLRRPWYTANRRMSNPCTDYRNSRLLSSGLINSNSNMKLEESSPSAATQDSGLSIPKVVVLSKTVSMLPAVLPDARPPTEMQIEKLHDFIANCRRMVVLTGAGISTESGIPDYRSPKGAYSSGFKPMTHQDFIRSARNRQRYWARSYVGWRRFIAAQPGDTHRALARLEARGRVTGGMITQNVDRLHHTAGSSPIELHGTTHETICLHCKNVTDRHNFQERLRVLNPEWASEVEALEKGVPGSDSSFGTKQRPDGDVEIGEEFWSRENFKIPACEICDGTLKPNVVFFGDNLPKERVISAKAMVTGGDALLVLGSSLMVLSAFRLVGAAREAGQPVALVNLGPTRADALATLKIEARCGEILNRVLATGSIDVPLL